MAFLLQRRCRTLLNDEAAAEDALQNAFVKFMHHKRALRAAANPVAWMYRVVDRCCFDQIRRRKYRRADSIDDPENDPNPHPGIDLEARNVVIRILHALREPRMRGGHHGLCRWYESGRHCRNTRVVAAYDMETTRRGRTWGLACPVRRRWRASRETQRPSPETN
jgi:hypothetical protein